MKTITSASKTGGERLCSATRKPVNKNLFALYLCADMSDADIDAKLAERWHDYERISERMYVEWSCQRIRYADS